MQVGGKATLSVMDGGGDSAGAKRVGAAGVLLLVSLTEKSKSKSCIENESYGWENADAMLLIDALVGAYSTPSQSYNSCLCFPI